MNNNLLGKDTTLHYTTLSSLDFMFYQAVVGGSWHNHKDALNAHPSFKPTVQIVEIKTEHDLETIETAKFVTLKLPSLSIFIKNKGSIL